MQYGPLDFCWALGEAFEAAPPAAGEAPPPGAREAFIGAMRRVASSVTVVTTDGPGGRHGATVSAFCSVSADPPAVLVCLKADSRIAAAVSSNGRFCVNVLPPSRRDLAERFAGSHDAQLADRFDGVECEQPEGEAPAIAGATHFACETGEALEFGTHRIFVGQVRDVRAGAPQPLAYLDGRYHRVVPQ